MLTITHTHEEGTLIAGTAKGDGTAAILRTHGWRWGRSISAWYIPHSRDRLPQHHKITRSAAALEAAGYALAPLELDTTHRTTAEVEADKIDRQTDRVDALEAKADRKADAATAAWNKHERDAHRLPAGGEPIKIGHHSETRHRRAIDKAHASMGRSIEAEHAAARARDRAKAAAYTTDARYSPVTVGNRIDRLAAELRKVEREITADRLDAERGYVKPTAEEQQIRADNAAPVIAELRDQLDYWQEIRAEQIRTGKATNYSAETVKKGDRVLVWGGWYEVARANAKSVSAITPHGWTERVPWHKVQGHKPAAS